MGEIRDDDEDIRDAWRALVEMGERYPGTEMADLSERLRQGGPPPESLRDTPLIVDTDIGGDADDAVAVAVAALRVSELALVVTTDEYGGDRARFARYFLDQLGRPEVPVVEGADLGNTRYYCVDGLFPAGTPRQPNDVVGAVADVFASTDGPVRWVGMGPLSNLSAVLRERPELADRLVVSQMGGAFNYRKPGQAEHNFRLDPEAVAHVLRVVRRPELVISDTTFTDDLEISARTPLYHRLAAAEAPEWAATLKAHLDRWFAHTYPSTIQHDGLTLSAALELPFVDFAVEHIVVDSIARMARHPDGVWVYASYSARYAAFMRWLDAQLDFAEAPTTGDPARSSEPRR